MKTPFATICLSVALVTGIIVQWLTLGVVPGLGDSLAIGLILLSFAVVGGVLGTQPTLVNLWIVVPIVFFVIMLSLRDSDLLNALNSLAALGLLCILGLKLRRDPIHRMTLVDQIRGGFVLGLNGFVRPIVLMSQASKEAEGGQGRRWALPLLRGLLLAAPLLCVFGALFASADLFFAGYVRRVFQQFSVSDLIGRIFVAAVIAWGLAALLALTFGDEMPAIPGEVKSEEAADAPPPRKQVWRLLGFVETAVMLVLVNLLFLSFVAVQIRHFFLEVEDFDLVGTNHAFYAREGFFQLLLAAFLTLALIWTLALIARRDNPVQDIAFNVLAVVMTGCVLVMLVSSFRWLELYEIEFGFTQLRILSHSFTVWIGVIFLFTLGALLSKRWGILAFGLLSAAIFYVAGFDIINPDAYIAQRNLDRAIEGKRLDVRHLTVLSSDAVPAMVDRVGAIPEADRSRVLNNLAIRLRQLKQEQKDNDWRSWNLSRDQAIAALLSRELPEPQFRN